MLGLNGIAELLMVRFVPEASSAASSPLELSVHTLTRHVLCVLYAQSLGARLAPSDDRQGFSSATKALLAKFEASGSGATAKGVESKAAEAKAEPEPARPDPLAQVQPAVVADDAEPADVRSSLAPFGRFQRLLLCATRGWLTCACCVLLTGCCRREARRAGIAKSSRACGRGGLRC